MSLDFGDEEFRQLLHQAADAVADLHQNQERMPVFRGETPADVRAVFDQRLPRSPVPADELIRRFRDQVIPTSTLTMNPNFYGYVVSAGNQIGVVAALLHVGANICNAKWDLAAGAAEIERTVIRWIAEFIGYPVETGGVLTTGGTIANLTCLHIARRARTCGDLSRSGLFDSRRLTAYASREVHSSIEGSMDLMGLGTDQLRSVGTRKDFRVDCDELERLIQADTAGGNEPFCIVGCAGSTNTGAVDDLDRLASIATKYGLWFHVDAAYGGPAAGTAIAKEMFAGLEKADSITLDPHKWLYLPVEMGCALIRDPEHLLRAFSLEPDYLATEGARSGEKPLDWFTRTFHHTRDAKAIRAWMSFLAHGADAIRAEIEANIRSMRYLGKLIDEASDFELLAPVPLSTVCFRYAPPGSDPGELDKLNSRLVNAVRADRRVFVPGTRVNGRVALRACTINHRHREAHADGLVAVVREVGERLRAAAKIGICCGGAPRA